MCTVSFTPLLYRWLPEDSLFCIAFCCHKPLSVWYFDKSAKQGEVNACPADPLRLVKRRPSPSKSFRLVGNAQGGPIYQKKERASVPFSLLQLNSSLSLSTCSCLFERHLLAAQNLVVIMFSILKQYFRALFSKILMKNCDFIVRNTLDPWLGSLNL